jgi:hypothetical protein
MDFKHIVSRKTCSRIVASMLGLLVLLIPLTSCGPTSLQFVPIDLGLPCLGLNAPVVGPLPDT